MSLRRACAALVAAGLLGAALAAPAMADTNGFQLNVNNTPYQGEQGQAYVQNVPQGQDGIDLFWQTSSNPQGTDVGSCSGGTCDFTIGDNLDDNGTLVAKAYQNIGGNKQYDYNSNGDSFQCSPPPNQLPEVPYALFLLPVFLGAGALLLRRRAARPGASA